MSNTCDLYTYENIHLKYMSMLQKILLDWNGNEMFNDNGQAIHNDSLRDIFELEPPPFPIYNNPDIYAMDFTSNAYGYNNGDDNTILQRYIDYMGGLGNIKTWLQNQNIDYVDWLSNLDTSGIDNSDLLDIIDNLREIEDSALLVLNDDFIRIYIRDTLRYRGLLIYDVETYDTGIYLRGMFSLNNNNISIPVYGDYSIPSSNINYIKNVGFFIIPIAGQLFIDGHTARQTIVINIDSNKETDPSGVKHVRLISWIMQNHKTVIENVNLDLGNMPITDRQIVDRPVVHARTTLVSSPSSKVTGDNPEDGGGLNYVRRSIVINLWYCCF